MDKTSDQLLKIVVYAASAVGAFYVLKAIGSFIQWLAPYMITSWVIVVLQGVGVLCSSAIAATISLYICGRVFETLIRRIDRLAYEQKEILKKLKDRTPTFVVAAALITQAVMAIVDKSFGESPVIIVVVTILLIILFFVANHMMVDDERYKRIFGWLLWATSVLVVPLFVLLHHGWTLSQLWGKMITLSTGTLLAFILLALVAIIMPFALSRK